MPRCDPVESPAFISVVDLVTGNETKLADTPGLTYLALSPDGDRVAYRTTTGMFVMGADGTGPVKVDSDEGYGIQWSPDGQWLMFQRGYDIWIVPAAGGSPRQIASEVGGPAW
jgi:Tol biopolymer transport system component